MSERRWVLDAWALLALLQKEEPAATVVKELIQAMQEDEAGGPLPIHVLTRERQ